MEYKYPISMGPVDANAESNETDLQKRMRLLGLSVEELAKKVFIEPQYAQAIFEGKVSLDDVDEFDLSLICSALHCKPEFFIDENVRKRDLLSNANLKKSDNRQSIKAKARIQDFINDFVFVKEVLSERI